MTLTSSPIRFGPFQLDPAAMELRRDGARVEVQPRVLAVLHHLSTRPDQLVSKEDLVQAVWHGEAVSDEVIARAIMKARRALGEEAGAPVHLYTEPGRGYRFRTGDLAPGTLPAAADPALPPPSSVPWRVLPFVNRSGNPALDWTSTGLQRLLCHAMESAGPDPVISDGTSPVQSADGAGSPAARVARALAVHPGERLVAGEVDETDAGHRVTLAWAAAGTRPASLSLEGAKLPDLLEEAAGRLLPPAPWQRALARSHPEAWAQLNELIAELFRWPRATSVRRLQRVFDRLPPHPQLLLRRAELLLALEEFESADEAARQAEQALAQEQPPDAGALLHAKVLLTDVAVRRGGLQTVQERVAAALDHAAAHETAVRGHRQLAVLWAKAAFLRRESGDFAEAVACYDRAILLGLRAGLTAVERNCRINQSEVLTWQGQPHRAEQVLRQVIARAVETDDANATSLAMNCLGHVLHQQGRHGDALHWAQRALAVALPVVDDARFARSARSSLIEALLCNGRFDEAASEMAWQARFGSPGVVAQLALLTQRAWLCARQGRLDEAWDFYARILQDPHITPWVKWTNYLRSEAAVVQALRGRLGEAGEVLQPLATVALPMVVGRARAALAMAEGRRTDALAGLRALLPQATPGQPDAYRVLIDLAWLCLEEGDIDQADELLDRTLVMGPDGVELAWLQLALQDRLAPVDAAAWVDLRARSPSLLRWMPALGTADDVQQRRSGRAPPLPNLLSVLAW